MAISVDVQKKLGEFELDVKFESTSKRIGILGASGCGKSMTLKSIAGIETPTDGKIQIGEHVLFDSKNKVNLKPQKRKIGYLFQNYALFPTMTVAQNIAAGLKGSKQEKEKRVREMAEKFNSGIIKASARTTFRRTAAKSRLGKNHGIQPGCDTVRRTIFCIGRIFERPFATGT